MNYPYYHYFFDLAFSTDGPLFLCLNGDREYIAIIFVLFESPIYLFLELMSRNLLTCCFIYVVNFEQIFLTIHLFVDVSWFLHWDKHEIINISWLLMFICRQVLNHLKFPLQTCSKSN